MNNEEKKEYRCKMCSAPITEEDHLLGCNLCRPCQVDIVGLMKKSNFINGNVSIDKNPNRCIICYSWSPGNSLFCEKCYDENVLPNFKKLQRHILILRL